MCVCVDFNLVFASNQRDLGRKFSGGAAHSAQRHRRRVGVAAAARVVRLRPPRRAPVTTGGRLNSPSGAGLDPGTLCDSCACRRVTTPGPAAGRTTSRPARTRRRWTTSAAQGLALSSPPRARCSRSAACRSATSCRAATRCRSCTASPGQPSSTRWSTPRRAGSLLRAGADRGCDSRLRRRVCGLAHARLRVQIPRRSRAPPPPARGGISVREFCVPVPVLHLLLPCRSLRTPLYSATS